MGWATQHIADLKEGKTISFRPRGNSMTGRINSGDLCTVEPCDGAQKGDVVLCTVRGQQYLHIVKAVRADEYQIGNNHGRINGWTNKKNIYGKLIRVQS